MSKALFSLVSILLLSLASTSYGLVLGDFEAGFDGWESGKEATINLSTVGASRGHPGAASRRHRRLAQDAWLNIKPNRARNSESKAGPDQPT